MIGDRHCFDFRSTEGEADSEERESCCHVDRRCPKNDFLQGSKISEYQRRQTLINYFEKLRREPLRVMKADVCRPPVRRQPVAGVRRSKTTIRRSSALVKNARRWSDENLCFCSDSVSPELPCCQPRMENVVPDCGGSILRGKPKATGTQTSRSNIRNSFYTYSRTKGSRNCRSQNRRKFPPLGKISNAFVDRLPRYETSTSSDKYGCCCFPNTNFERAPKYLQRSNDYVITTASTSEEEIVDYQVPVKHSSSFHTLCETGSGSKTLVPTSSHVTIRICSRNSSPSLRSDRFCDEADDRQRSSGSETCLNHLEDRVQRDLRSMCCCEHPEAHDVPEKLENDQPYCQPGYSSLTECQASSTNPSPRSDKRSCCCQCELEYCPAIGFEQSSDEGSFQRFKHILTETKPRREPRRTYRLPCGPKRSFLKSDRTTCRQKNQEIRGTRPRRVLRKRPPCAEINLLSKNLTNNECIGNRDSVPEHPIVLSASRYKEFCDRCESIRKSMRNMTREEPGTSACEPSMNEAPIWKGDSLNLQDLAPDLPPLDHWSQYEDGMRKVANEYRTLKSCVNLIEDEAGKKDPSCSCTEKSVTRTYPSGTEFTFKVKRVPEKKACQTFPRPAEGSGLLRASKKSSSTQRDQNFRGKGRSVCFEKSDIEEELCCDCPEEVNQTSQNDGLVNIEAMREREADLVKTLESFCEKMKAMKKEFEKFSNPASCSAPPKDPGSCPSCGRGTKGTGFKKLKAKKLLIFPPEGENGPPLTLRKNSSSINCRVKGDRDTGFRYHVVYIQRFVSSTWNPEKEARRCCVDSG